MSGRTTADVAGRLVPVPWGQRPRRLTPLDGPTAAAYRAGVARVAPCIESRLGPWVIANRVRPTGPAHEVRLEPWRHARRRFLAEVRRRAAGRAVVLVTDVRDCYPSIGPDVVEERLTQLGCEGVDVGALVSLLRELQGRGIRGLPIGPEPSAVLANGVLEAADRAVASGGAEHLRWVDDFVVFTDDAAHAGAILDRLKDALAGIGLALSVPKTRLLAGPDLARGDLGRGSLSDLVPRL